MEVYLGIDIGGTKCALVLGDAQGCVTDKVRFETADKDSTLTRIMQEAEDLIAKAEARGDAVRAIGVSCGGPLDSTTGVIVSPPNLPLWHGFAITDYIKQNSGLSGRRK